MHLLCRKISSENIDDRPWGSRRNRRSQMTETDLNINTSNSVSVENDLTPKPGLDLPSMTRRTSGSKSPARNRMGKSKLIETMAANFERKKTENSNSFSSTMTQRPSLNGETKISLSIPTRAEPPKVEVNSGSPPDTKKSGPSARRGKIQREKRMLRQKRRSTGVVNLKDIENDEEKNTNSNEKDLQNETKANTESNELSPLGNHTSASRVVLSNSENVTSRLESNGSYDTSATSTTRVSNLVTSKHYGSRSDEISIKPSQSEVEDLRVKLESAEASISKLRKEIKSLDNELHVLEDENHQLKKANKMLEDENNTMLRLMRGK